MGPDYGNKFNYSIAEEIFHGIICYTVIKAESEKFKEISITMAILSLVFVLTRYTSERYYPSHGAISELDSRNGEGFRQ